MAGGREKSRFTGKAFSVVPAGRDARRAMVPSSRRISARLVPQPEAVVFVSVSSYTPGSKQKTVVDTPPGREDTVCSSSLPFSRKL